MSKQDKIKHLMNASAIAWKNNNAEDVVKMCTEVTELDPTYAAAYSNIGTALWSMLKPEEACEYFKKSLEIDPNYMEAILNMGTLCHDLGNLEDAEQYYERASKLRPHNADINWRKSLINLAQGKYLEGWAAYDEGLGIETIRGNLLNFNTLPWDGKACNHLLICHEQGYGDTLQFIRYAQLCKTRARKVYVLCPTEMHKIISSCPWVDGVMSVAHDGDFEQYVYTLSLPHIFQTTLETVPAPIPYLHSSEEAKTRWNPKFESVEGIKIGLVWAGNPRKDNIRYRVSDSKRSMSLAKYEKILSFHDKGVNFYSLQKDNADEINNYPQVINFMGDVSDFDDTAAIIKNLDLVISVDTSVVHLTGALGVPVWVLSRFDACWRWLRNRPDSPWYPNARIYGQPSVGDWDSVIDKIYSDLERLV